MNTALSSFSFTLLIASASILPAVEAGGEAISAPAPGPERYRNLWSNSPFLRPLNAAESYVLTGVARFDGKPMVTMLNTATGERITLTTESNSLGWRLIDLNNDPNPRNIMARVTINGEEVAIRFNERQISPDALLKASDGSGRTLPFSTPRAPGSILKDRLPKTSEIKPKPRDPEKNKRQRRPQASQ